MSRAVVRSEDRRASQAARARLIRGGLGIALYLALALAPLVLVVAHTVLLFVFEPGTLGLLDIAAAPWRARMAVLSVVALLAIVATAVWRARLRLSYERWRLVHDLLAIVLVAAAVAHVELVGHYVSMPWKRALWVTYAAMTVLLVLWVRLGKPLVRLRRPYRVAEVRPEGPEVWSVRLEPQDHRGLDFEPGQFAWITLGASPFSLEEHPFSFSSSAAERGSFELTVKELGDFTRRIGTIEVGTRAYVDGPFGAFDPERYPADGHVFVAGGVGITPFMSILRTAADRHDPTPVVLFYAAPTLERLVFADEIADLAQRLPLRFVPVIQQPPESWTGERGYLTREVLERHLARPVKQECFLCGPPPMIEAVIRSLREMGVPQGRIHYERFDFV